MGDARRHGGREERHLTFGRSLLQDPLDVLDESHVEHLVRLVEDEEADVIQFQRAAAHVVHDPARRADHDLHAALQTAELPLVRLAAVDRQRFDVLVAAVFVQRLGDLNGELACRRQDQRLNRALLGIDGLDDGKPESGRLPRSGLRLGDHVPAGKKGGDDLDLNWRGGFVADVLDRFQQRGVEAELLERWSVVGLDFAANERHPVR